MSSTPYWACPCEVKAAYNVASVDSENELDPALPHDPAPAPDLAGQSVDATEADERAVEVDWPSGTFIGGRYKIQRRIGCGGMAEVFLADDFFLRKLVAVKALKPSVARKARNVERFRKEVALAHTVTHPNVVRIHDLGEHDEILFISMEYLEGESLQNRLGRSGKLPVEEVREIALAVCDALGAAHQARVVHRDLKPSNIMIVANPRRIVVMDFGISGITQEAANPEDAEPFAAPPPGGEIESGEWAVTSSGMGTLKYMSPEQVLRRPCGPPSDFYALGAILFRCLTGRHIFSRKDGSYAFAHVRREAPRLRSIDPTIPKAFDGAVARCLRKDPSDRFQSAADLARVMSHQRFSNMVSFFLRVLAASVVIVFLGYGLFTTAEEAIIREMRPAVSRLAYIAAQPIAAEELDELLSEEDVETRRFREIREHFRQVKAENPEVESIYVLRKLEEPEMWEFAADLEPHDQDRDGNGVIEGFEKGSPPGAPYPSEHVPGMSLCLSSGRPGADDRFIADEYGFTLSGYAPIGDVRGPGGYILGIDVGNSQIVSLRKAIAALCAAAWGLLVGSYLIVEYRASRRRG